MYDKYISKNDYTRRTINTCTKKFENITYKKACA